MLKKKIRRATREDAVKVLELWYNGTLIPRDIADMVGISKNAVMRIVREQLYPSLPRPDSLPSWRY